ncbi:heparin lyase I family protein [Aquimarina sp. Aq107]|uniref:heparin lyase I family protein n=1 Tax=Aquimarina sp. Aq107 TaxID=1191912 RepID=UPI000D55D255|nr:heparin lyase I family protein [Aquimarina sp. Aq107]
MKFAFVLFALLTYISSYAQVSLTADGPGNTYELITSKLAPGYNPIEAPGMVRKDCDNHLNYGEHISEVYDDELAKNVFKFVIHVKEDNDRCKTFDRQRNEIKSYKSSPDNLKATIGETVEYKWKFKIDKNFKPSKNFTHLHQLKSVGETEKAKPIITLTARKGSVDKLELRHSSGKDQNTLKKVDLDLLRGNWVMVTEKVTYGNLGKTSYDISIANIKTGKIILEYQSTNLQIWNAGAEFVRPKWGIYRSLKNAQNLRDEEVLFADFSIKESK